MSREEAEEEDGKMRFDEVVVFGCTMPKIG
jgi:hypothetical protein